MHYSVAARPTDKQHQLGLFEEVEVLYCTILGSMVLSGKEVEMIPDISPHLERYKLAPAVTLPPNLTRQISQVPIPEDSGVFTTRRYSIL